TDCNASGQMTLQCTRPDIVQQTHRKVQGGSAVFTIRVYKTGHFHAAPLDEIGPWAFVTKVQGVSVGGWRKKNDGWEDEQAAHPLTTTACCSRSSSTG